MFRVRFHGRGGHGVKTASRILGTAAFLAGFQVQDSPVFGAERRGAPVTAYTRIDSAAIRERGTIDHPDLIVIADHSLLADRTSGVLAGANEAAGILLNCVPETAAALATQDAITSLVLADDLSARTRRILGRASALSAGLGAAAARVLGCIPQEAIQSAIREELTTLGVPSSVIDRNVLVANELFEALHPLDFHVRKTPPSTDRVRAAIPQNVVLGAPSIASPGNATQRLTSSWRVERPEIDYDVCSGCRLCYLACPEGAIALNESGKPMIDYEHCKGCMICWQLCPLHGIARRQEVQAW